MRMLTSRIRQPLIALLVISSLGASFLYAREKSTDSRASAKEQITRAPATSSTKTNSDQSKSGVTQRKDAGSAVLTAPLAPAQISPAPVIPNAPLLSPAVGEQIKWQVFSGGGGRSTSATYVLQSTIGQAAAGPSSSASYALNSGYQQNFSSGCCDVAGDADNDASVTIGDAVYLIGYIFLGGGAPPCIQEGDADGDASITIGDAVYLIGYIFLGGGAPVCGP